MRSTVIVTNIFWHMEKLGILAHLSYNIFAVKSQTADQTQISQNLFYV